MAAEILRNEIDTIIMCSGSSAHSKMRCSILRVLKMRHAGLDTASTLEIIDEAIKTLS